MMPLDPAGFYGLWDVYSGPAHFELLLHDDGSYGQAMWGGAQQAWGRWLLQDVNNQLALVLEVQGTNPPWLLGVNGPQPVTEYHAVMNAQPNQIQLYDALMVRRYVPAAPQAFPTPIAMPMPQYAPSHAFDHVRAQDFINAIRSAPTPQPTTMPQMPIAPPVAAYSAPAPPPVPAMQSAPLTAQMIQTNDAVARQIQNIQTQMYKDDRQTSIDIESAQSAMDTVEFTARAKALQDQEQASHGMAQRFTDQVIKGGRMF
jgi:hypothetical protein